MLYEKVEVERGMYEVFMQNSDFIKTNLIMREDVKGMLEGYHETVNGRNMVFQIAHLLYKNNRPELQVYPVKEHLIRRLQMEPDELTELAIINLKRLAIIHTELAIKEFPEKRRVYGSRRK